MFASIYTSLSGGLMQERRMEVISNNLANSNTNGFKKDIPVFESFLLTKDKSRKINESANNTENLMNYANKGTNNVMAGTAREKVQNENVFVTNSKTVTSHEQGPLKPTGNQLDLAIEGKGMFGFQTENGVMYGRNGTFHLNSDGEMVNGDGFPLLDRNENPIVINLEEMDMVNFGRDGEIIGVKGNQSTPLGYVKLSEFERPEELEKVGSSLFRNRDDIAGEKSLNNPNTRVVQGFVELSNVNVVREMTDMIQINRGYQSMQKVIQSIDGINQKLIQIVGRPI